MLMETVHSAGRNKVSSAPDDRMPLSTGDEASWLDPPDLDPTRVFECEVAEVATVKTIPSLTGYASRSTLGRPTSQMVLVRVEMLRLYSNAEQLWVKQNKTR